MAIFHITPATSRFITGGNTAAFGGVGNPFDDRPFPDTLIVDQGAYLIAAGHEALHGAFLANTGAWTVVINGSVISTVYAGIWVEGSNPGTTTITIGTEGEVSGLEAGIVLVGGTTVINNAGVISSTSTTAISSDSLLTLTNSGDILKELDLNGPSASLTNTATGTIEGLFCRQGNIKLLNAGEIDHSIIFEQGINTFNNSGHVTASAYFAGHIDTIINSGIFTGDITAKSDTEALTNSGKIFGPVNLDADANRLTNSGEIDGTITFGNGTNKLTNSGTIVGDVNGGTLIDTFTNSGTITGEVHLNVSDDVFTDYVIDAAGVMHSGTVGVGIDLGEGQDKFFGGSKAEAVVDSAGSDLIKLGGGDDVYHAVTANIDTNFDTIDGGSGIDTYDALQATDAVKINLDSVIHKFSVLLNDPSTYGDVAPHTATGADVAGLNADIVTNFENVRGGFGADVIYGNAVANTLTGQPGNDALFGFAGNDTLDGGDGVDLLYGGPGKDILTGGANDDKFIYGSIHDSGVARATRDVITDFAPGSGAERINLSLIDANTKVAGDQAFTYVNNDSSVTPAAKFTGTPGDLRSYWNVEGEIIEGDVNGDKVADFSIQIADPTHALAIHYYDFVL